MKQKWIFIVVLVAVMSAVVIHLRPTHASPPMPLYHGKTAEQWLDLVFTTNQDSPISLETIESFKAMGSNALPVLLRAFEGKDIERANAAEMVAISMPYAKAAKPDLIRLLEKGYTDNSISILRTLLEFIAPSDSNCVPVLIQFVSPGDTMSRELAVLCLGHIGPSAGPAAVSALKGILSEPTSASLSVEDELRLKMSAARALWKIDGETGITSQALQEVKDHSTNVLTQSAALSFLSDTKPEDDSLINPIIELINSPNNQNQKGLVIRLGHYGQKAKAALPVLIPLLSSTNIELSNAALKSLKQIDPTSAEKYEIK